MRWWKWAGQGWMTGPKGLSKVTESKYLSESSWEDIGWGPGRFWAWLSFPLQQSPTWAVVVSMGAHSLWQMCFFLPAMNNSLLVASCITSHVVFGQDAALDTSDCKLPHDCRSTLYGLCRGTCQTTHPHSHPSAGSTRPCLFLCGPFGTWPLLASCTVEGGDFFLSLGPFSSSLCMGVAARSQQQCWIPAPWVKAGRLPAKEMLWKWDLLLLCRGTGYFRSRLCWRYGLGQDYCSCWGKCCCTQSFPVSKVIDIT